MNYYDEYIKYKQRYLDLSKNCQEGGNGELITAWVFFTFDEKTKKYLDDLSTNVIQVVKKQIQKKDIKILHTSLVTIRASNEMHTKINGIIMEEIKNIIEKFKNINIDVGELKLLPENGPLFITLGIIEKTNILSFIRLKIKQAIESFILDKYKEINVIKTNKKEQYKKFEVLDYDAIRYILNDTEILSLRNDEFTDVYKYHISLTNRNNTIISDDKNLIKDIKILFSQFDITLAPNMFNYKIKKPKEHKVPPTQNVPVIFFIHNIRIKKGQAYVPVTEPDLIEKLMNSFKIIKFTIRKALNQFMVDVYEEPTSNIISDNKERKVQIGNDIISYKAKK